MSCLCGVAKIHVNTQENFIADFGLREPDGHLLRQLRKTLGPSRLASSWRREAWR